MIKEHINGLGEFEFHDRFFIGRIAEGANAGAEFVNVLSELILKHFSRRPIIYVSDRVNSYSLDPIATMDLIQRNNIKFAGVVTYTAQQLNEYSYEERSIKGIAMSTFFSLDEAITWAKHKSLELI